jgi:hypothetical protein
MTMNETKLTKTPQTPTNEEQPRHKDAYRAPRLVVLGTAVELVQGYGGLAYIDGQGFNRRHRN